MNFSETTKVFAHIPPEKRSSKARKTAIGAGSVVLALVIAKWLPMLSVWAVYVLLVYGGYCLAGDLVRGFASFLPAVIRDIRSAWKGTSSGQ
jgi:hypothetical protein